MRTLPVGFLFLRTCRLSAFGVSASACYTQQKFIEAESGDYRLAKYSDIKINEKIPDEDFKLKTTGKTKVVNAPSGI